MNPTRKNHLNPCSWTALWNEDYFNRFVAGQPLSKARHQMIFCLDIKSPNVFQCKVEKVHFIEGFGTALVTKQELIKLKSIKQIQEMNDLNINEIGDDEKVILDIEKQITTLEEGAGYHQIKEIVKSNRITKETQPLAAIFMVFHDLRGRRFFSMLLDKYKEHKNPKLEAFIHLQRLMENSDILTKEAIELLKYQWTLYSLDDFSFPLNDMPIIYHKEFVWLPISPKHLIEIDKTILRERFFKHKTIMTPERKKEILKQIILHTHTQLIFPRPEFLAKIRKSRNWQSRINFLKQFDE